MQATISHARWLDSADRHARNLGQDAQHENHAAADSRARLGCRRHYLGHFSPRACRRGLSGTPRDDHQSICSGQHLGRRGASDCAIPAGSIPAALHRREPGRRRRPGRSGSGRPRRAGWLHAAGDGQFPPFRGGAVQGAADPSDEGLHPYRPDRELSFIHRGALRPPRIHSILSSSSTTQRRTPASSPMVTATIWGRSSARRSSVEPA